MGVTLALLEDLRSRGVFNPSANKPLRLLDVGASNLYQGEPASLRAFASHLTQLPTTPETDAALQRLADGSRYDAQRGGLNESWLGQYLELCGVQYDSIDIAVGYKTRIIDLNAEALPEDCRKAFNIVLNCGTTEHLVNQLNAFNVIHDAASIGGFIVHQVPSSGFTDHGYFSYTGRFFFDLCRVNQYELVDLWYNGPAGSDDVRLSLRSFARYFPQLSVAETCEVPIPNWAINVVFRKQVDEAFRLPLETATSVGAIPAKVRAMYSAEMESIPSLVKQLVFQIRRRLLPWN